MGDDGKTYGPFSSTQLIKCVEQGRIHKETLVRRDGSERWVPADKINGLQNHLSVSTNFKISRSRLTDHEAVQRPDESRAPIAASVGAPVPRRFVIFGTCIVSFFLILLLFMLFLGPRESEPAWVWDDSDPPASEVTEILARVYPRHFKIDDMDLQRVDKGKFTGTAGDYEFDVGVGEALGEPRVYWLAFESKRKFERTNKKHQTNDQRLVELLKRNSHTFDKDLFFWGFCAIPATSIDRLAERGEIGEVVISRYESGRFPPSSQAQAKDAVQLPKCSACLEEVPASSKVGDRCPHCGAMWISVTAQ